MMLDFVKRSMLAVIVALVSIDTIARSAEQSGNSAADPEFEKYFGPQRDWPRLRGPMGNGVCREKGLPTTWNKKTGENILWAVDLFDPKPIYWAQPYASPIVYKDKVFCLLGKYKDSLFVTPLDPKKGAEVQLKTPVPIKAAEVEDILVVCFNKADGKRIWECAIEPGDWKSVPVGFHGNEHSIVLASPCTDGERVYGLLAGGNGNPAKNSKLAFAVDYYGKQVWRRELDGWETWASPVIYKDMVIYDLQGGSGFIALDRKTGEVKYFVPHGNNGWHYVSHAFTPVPMLSGGVPFLLTNSAGDHHIEGRNPEDGKVVWFAKGKTIGTQSMSGTVGDGFIYCDGGGNGKESFYSGAAFNLASLAKSNGNIAGIAGTETCCVEQQKFPSVGGLVDWEGSGPVISNGYIYREFGNFVWCIEAATGKVVYQEKLNMGTYGGYFSAPFATADGLIYFASAGRSVVLKAGPKFELVADNKLGDGGLAPRPKADDTTYSHSSPAVSDGKIFILGTTKLWCIGSK